jgi:hypothetical protein
MTDAKGIWIGLAVGLAIGVVLFVVIYHMSTQMWPWEGWA